MSTSRKPAIIKLGSTLPSLSAHRGDFEDWVLAGMGMQREDVIIVDPRRGEPLPGMDDISGAVLTGSHDMVTDHAEWSERTADWTRQAVLQGLPILGICYGHQLLAYALGGEVGNNPLGTEMGTVTARLKRAAHTDWLLGGFGESIRVQVSHRQSVLKLPAEARILAGSDRDPYLAFAVRRHVWGLQFHPEFDAEVVKAYIRVHKEELREQGQDPDMLLRTCSPSSVGSEILQRFAQLITTAVNSA